MDLDFDMKELRQTEDCYFLLDTGCHINVSNDTLADILLPTSFLKIANFIIRCASQILPLTGEQRITEQ